jgi:agmatinase
MKLKKANISKFNPNGAASGDAGIFGLPFTYQESNVVLVPVPFEMTTSYGRGTVSGPKAIREASPQLDLFDAEFASHGLPRPWEFGIHMEKELRQIKTLNKDGCQAAKPIISKGGEIGKNKTLQVKLAKANKISDSLNKIVFDKSRKALQQNKIVGLVGGDHSVSFGAIQAIAQKYPKLGILHIDAHADLRDAYEGFEHSHASIMNNVIHKIPGVSRVVQVGIRDFCDEEYQLAKSHPKIDCHFDVAVRDRLFKGESFEKIVASIIRPLPDRVYISFDIDGLEPSLCPSTGTPVPGGLSFQQASFIIKAVALSGRTIVGFDLVEVAPSGKKDDEWDGNVGARILYKLCAAALFSHGVRN